MTNEVKAGFEDWLEYEARARVFDMRSQLSVAEFRESMRAVTAASASTLTWGGEACEEALRQVPGIVKLVQLLAKEAGEELTEERVHELLGETAFVVKGERGYLKIYNDVCEEGKEPLPHEFVESADDALLFDDKAIAEARASMVDGEIETVNVSQLGDAVREVMSNTPNFTSPPIRRRGRGR